MRLFLSIIALLSSITFVNSAFAAALNIGQAAVVRGEVYVERNTNKQPLKARDRVYQGDKILTGEKGKVQIIFADDTIFTIGREAEILLDKYVYDPSTHEGVSEIKAKKGTFKFVTGKIAKKNPKHVRVKTPFATIGVRGSGGLVDVALNGATTVGLTQCCLDLFANGAPAGTPPVPLDGVNSYSQVTSPNQPPSIPAPMPPEMVQQLNGDLAGGFAPVEGEGIGGDTPADGQNDGADNDNNQPSKDNGEDGTPADDGDQPPANSDGEQGGQVADDTANPPPVEDGDATTGGDQPPLDQNNDPLLTDNPPLGADGEPLQPLGDGTQPPPPGGDGFVELSGDGFGDFGSMTLDGSDPLLITTDPLLADGTTAALEPVTVADAPVVDTTQTTQDGTSADVITTSTNATNTHTGVFRRKIAGETIIREGNLSGSLIGGQFVGDFTDFDGSTFSGALPVPGTIGNFVQPGFSFNAVSFDGEGYRSANSDYVLYDLGNVAGDKLYVAAGTQISVPTTGINNFEFRSDPFSAGAVSQSSGSQDGGLIVDWGRKKFLGGDIKIFNDSNGIDYRYATTVGFGDVLTAPNSNGANAIGEFIDIQTELSGGLLNDTRISAGSLEAVEVFGTGTDVSGFILDINQESGNSPTGDANNQTEYSINPIVRMADDPVTAAEVAAFGSAKDYKGFLGGYIMKVDAAGGAEAFDRITNGVVNSQVGGGVDVNVDPSGIASASLKGWTRAGDMYDVDFGSVAGGQSAAISADAYAVEQVHSTVNRFNIFAGSPNIPSPTATGRSYMFDKDNSAGVTWNNTTAIGLVAPDSASFDGFAESLDMHGAFAVVGAPNEDEDAVNGNTLADAGSVYFYGRDNVGAWGFGQKVVASDRTAGDLFGSDVSVDFGRAIIGASSRDGIGVDQGGAYIFHWDGTNNTWVEEAIIAASDAQDTDFFGTSVDIYGDYAVVGAYQEDTNGANAGAAYIYKWNGTAWGESQVLRGTDTIDSFGFNVAMHDDLLVVGAPDVSVDGLDNDGKIYIYRKDAAGAFNLETSFDPTDIGGLYDGFFGQYVDVEDNTIVVGTPQMANGGTNRGLVSVFRYDGATWSFESNISASDSVNNGYFGTDVRISGNSITTGATGATGDSAGSGAFYVYEYEPQTGGGYVWTETVTSQGPLNSNTASDDFGSAVAFSGAVVSQNDNGALISDALSDVQCTACAYVHWGVWAGKIENSEVLSAGGTALAQMVPYVAGELLDATTLNSFSGTGSYTGITIGSILDSSNNLTHHHGNFTTSVDFANRDVTFTGDLGSYSFGATGSGLWTGGENAFNIPITAAAGITGGEINGAFFGQNAQDIGGNFQFDTAATSAAGVYLGNDAAR
jgi:hypothetical protein